MRTWIKLYTEMLLDPKVAKWPDWLFRRFIQLLLCAGINDQNGVLQPVTDLAWLCRLDENQVLQTLQALSEAGVASKIDAEEQEHAVWTITNFAKRQYSESYERVKRFRDKHAGIVTETLQVTLPPPVTVPSSTSTSFSSLLDINEEKEKKKSDGAAFRAYSQNFGAITPMIAEAVVDAIHEYSEEWVIAAIEAAVKANVRKWNYADAILKRWKVDGFQTKVGENAGKSLEQQGYRYGGSQ